MRGKSQEEHPTRFSGSTKVLYAKRQIKKGEEVCVNYAPFSGGGMKEERFTVLQSWIGVGKECGCSKCRRET